MFDVLAVGVIIAAAQVASFWACVWVLKGAIIDLATKGAAGAKNGATHAAQQAGGILQMVKDIVAQVGEVIKYVKASNL